MMENVDYKDRLVYEGAVASETSGPDISAGSFEGPLDLLCFLIEKNKVNIYDIPISEITDQYIEHMNRMVQVDLNLASEFLLMASTLLIIKSRMLLPKLDKDSSDYIDPREELVFKILEYRRCRNLAQKLKDKEEIFAPLVFKEPEPMESLGISREYVEENLDSDLFFDYADGLAKRNRLRFTDISDRLASVLARDKVSIKGKMKKIWESITQKTRVYFNEIFPMDQTQKIERVVGFLAVLELLKNDLMDASQKKSFGVIALKRRKAKANEDIKTFENLFSKERIEEIDYL